MTIIGTSSKNGLTLLRMTGGPWAQVKSNLTRQHRCILGLETFVRNLHGSGAVLLDAALTLGLEPALIFGLEPQLVLDLESQDIIFGLEPWRWTQTSYAT